ncbi:FAD-dependent monooxygenase [Candidatus Frankia alpina]|uniref:FAD-dependent monooxygenase n=1 Tax=Candidatus Frankia alpina TaxID=2699483 RepID=UPI001F3E456A|nr:FAD-dependent monooxygenase [Candidatus Frankia alpina]
MAARWRVGRVLLAGDAAHSMPPFAGQGLGAGLRDAAALSWRLAEVVDGLAGEELLDAYERERRPHVAAMTSAALRVGRVVQTTNPRLSRLTRAAMVTLDHAPGVRHALRSGVARPRPRLPRGVAGTRPAAGQILPNPRLRTLDGRIIRLDDLLTDGWALIGRGVDPTAGMDPTARDWADRRAATALTVVAPAVCGPSATSPARRSRTSTARCCAPAGRSRSRSSDPTASSSASCPRRCGHPTCPTPPAAPVPDRPRHQGRIAGVLTWSVLQVLA